MMYCCFCAFQTFAAAHPTLNACCVSTILERQNHCLRRSACIFCWACWSEDSDENWTSVFSQTVIVQFISVSAKSDSKSIFLFLGINFNPGSGGYILIVLSMNYLGGQKTSNHRSWPRASRSSFGSSRIVSQHDYISKRWRMLTQ